MRSRDSEKQGWGQAAAELSPSPAPSLQEQQDGVGDGGVTAKTPWERGLGRRTRGCRVAAGSVPVPRVLSSHGDPHDAIVTVVPLRAGWIPQAPASLGGSSGNWCHRVSEGGTCTPWWHLHPKVTSSTPRWHPAPQGTWKHKASREPRRAQTPVPGGRDAGGHGGVPERSGMTKPLASGTKEVPWPRAAPRPPGSLRQSQTAPDQPQNAWHRCCLWTETP